MLRGKVGKLVRDGQFEQALALVTAVLESEQVPTQETLLWRARTYESCGRPAEALADAEAALGLSGNDAIGAQKIRAKALRALGRMQEAEAAEIEMAKLAKPSAAAQNAFWGFMENRIKGVDKSAMMYVIGNAHAPDDPVGQDRLSLTDDERFELINTRKTLKKVWRGRCKPGFFVGMEKRLEESTFPQLPTRPPVAGAALRELTYQGRCALLPVHEPGLNAADKALFAELDQFVEAIKAGLPTGDIEEVTVEATS